MRTRGDDSRIWHGGGCSRRTRALAARRTRSQEALARRRRADHEDPGAHPREARERSARRPPGGSLRARLRSQLRALRRSRRIRGARSLHAVQGASGGRGADDGARAGRDDAGARAGHRARGQDRDERQGDRGRRGRRSGAADRECPDAGRQGRVRRGGGRRRAGACPRGRARDRDARRRARWHAGVDDPVRDGRARDRRRGQRPDRGAARDVAADDAAAADDVDDATVAAPGAAGIDRAHARDRRCRSGSRRARAGRAGRGARPSRVVLAADLARPRGQVRAAGRADARGDHPLDRGDADAELPDAQFERERQRRHDDRDARESGSYAGVMAEGELGVVLKTTPLRESDLLVVLYTATHGRVAAVARGARRSQRRFAGALQLLVLGRYAVRRSRGELWSLEAADVEREWTAIASDVFAVAHASYIAELVAGIMPAESPEPEALDVIVGLWESLAEGGASPAALRHVELALLELAGHMPALASCAACGERDLEAGAVFDPS